MKLAIIAVALAMVATPVLAKNGNEVGGSGSGPSTAGNGSDHVTTPSKTSKGSKAAAGVPGGGTGKGSTSGQGSGNSTSNDGGNKGGFPTEGLGFTSRSDPSTSNDAAMGGPGGGLSGSGNVGGVGM